jgi:hypothetical protein
MLSLPNDLRTSFPSTTNTLLRLTQLFPLTQRIWQELLSYSPFKTQLPCLATLLAERVHARRTVSGEGDSALVLAAVAALEDAYTDADIFETISQVREDELEDAGTFELVHHIRGKAPPNELALASFTRRKLKHLPSWDIWLASEWK